jgi:Dis3-like cold-shock domain 2 (CSD2)
MQHTRIPRCLVPSEQIPGITANAEQYADKYAVCRIGDWRVDSQFPIARYQVCVGEKIEENRKWKI